MQIYCTLKAMLSNKLHTTSSHRQMTMRLH